jgi:hypothetical protein
MNDTQEERGTLTDKEYHPAADSAMIWIKWFIAADPLRWLQIKEALASTALSGNRMSEICLSTIERLASGAPVSDRYLLGLCWFLRDNFERDEHEQNEQARSQTTAKATARTRSKKRTKTK